jgi:hypothetical protein
MAVCEIIITQVDLLQGWIYLEPGLINVFIWEDAWKVHIHRLYLIFLSAGPTAWPGLLCVVLNFLAYKQKC